MATRIDPADIQVGDVVRCIDTIDFSVTRVAGDGIWRGRVGYNVKRSPGDKWTRSWDLVDRSMALPPAIGTVWTRAGFTEPWVMAGGRLMLSLAYPCRTTIPWDPDLALTTYVPAVTP